MAVISHTELSQQGSRSRMGRVGGAEEARDPEVLWCEMPGAVNREEGDGASVAKAGISSGKESGSGH